MDGHQKVYTLRQNFKRLWVNLTLPGSPSDGESTRYEVLTQAVSKAFLKPYKSSLPPYEVKSYFGINVGTEEQRS